MVEKENRFEGLADTNPQARIDDLSRPSAARFLDELHAAHGISSQHVKRGGASQGQLKKEAAANLLNQLQQVINRKG